jgi:hypothetical protein
MDAEKGKKGGGNDFPRGPLQTLAGVTVGPLTGSGGFGGTIRGMLGVRARGPSGRGPVPGRLGRAVAGRVETAFVKVGGELDSIRRISIRARGMSNAATRGRTHVSTRPLAQTWLCSRLHPTVRPQMSP